jgi:hypothetical protein
MRHKAPIFGVAMGMTALAWAVREQLIISLFVVCAAIFVAVSATLEKPDPDSASALRKQLRSLAKIARSTDPVTFLNEHFQEVQGVAHVVGNKFGVLANRDMTLFLTKTPTSTDDLANVANALESLAGRL